MTPPTRMHRALQLGPQPMTVGGRQYLCLNPVEDIPGTFIAVPRDHLRLMVVTFDGAVYLNEGDTNITATPINRMSAQLIVQLLATGQIDLGRDFGEAISRTLPQLIHHRLVIPSALRNELLYAVPDTGKFRMVHEQLVMLPRDAELIDVLESGLIAATKHRLSLFDAVNEQIDG